MTTQIKAQTKRRWSVMSAIGRRGAHSSSARATCDDVPFAVFQIQLPVDMVCVAGVSACIFFTHGHSDDGGVAVLSNVGVCALSVWIFSEA